MGCECCSKTGNNNNNNNQTQINSFKQKEHYLPSVVSQNSQVSNNINISILAWDNDNNAESNLSSRKLPLIFELSEDEYKNNNNKISNILNNIKNNKYFLLFNFKTQSIKSFNSNKIKKEIEAQIKYLKKIYIFWINKTGDLSKIVIDNNYLIGTTINDQNEIEILNNDINNSKLKLKIIKQHFSLLNRQSETIVEYCQKNNIYFFSDLIMEDGALSGKYNSNNLFPENSPREIYNSQIDKIDNLNKELKCIVDKKNGTEIFQIPISWALAKGTFPLIKIKEFENKDFDDIIKSNDIILSEDEMVILERTVDELMK